MRLWCTIGWSVSAVLAVGALVSFVNGLPIEKTTTVQLTCVGLFAALVGFGELVSRYKDDPVRLMGSSAACVYVVVNITAGIAALALVHEFQVFGHPDHATPHQAVYEALLASFGAIAFFRSSVFTARVGDTDVGIGPSTLLKSLLDATDLMVDRNQAGDRAIAVGYIMHGVDFDKAKVSLPTLCLALVEGLPEEQQRLIGEQIAKLIEQPDLSSENKSTILGVYLLRQVGAAVLESAVRTLGDQIRRATPSDGTPLVAPNAPASKA